MYLGMYQAQSCGCSPPPVPTPGPSHLAGLPEDTGAWLEATRNRNRNSLGLPPVGRPEAPGEFTLAAGLAVGAVALWAVGAFGNG